MTLKSKRATKKCKQRRRVVVHVGKLFIDIMKNLVWSSYDTDNETLPIPLKYVNVMRRTQTRGVDWDCRIPDLACKTSEGHKWCNGRPSKIQKTSRPDRKMAWSLNKILTVTKGKHKLQNGQKKVPTASSTPQQRNPRGIDRWTKITSGDCWRSSEIGKGMLLPLCRALRRMTAERNLRQLQLQLMAVRSSQIQKIHEHAEKWSDMDHIAEKTYVGSLHYGLVHKPISVQETVKIQEAKAAVDEYWKKFSRKFQHGTWKMWDQSLKSSEERWKTVHLANLMDPCHLKNAGHAKHLQKYKGRVVLGGDNVKDEEGIHLRWQRQRSWHAWRKTWRSFSVARWPMLPDCCDCQQKNVLKYWSRFFHDKDQTSGIRWAILWHFWKVFFLGHPFASLSWERKFEGVLFQKVLTGNVFTFTKNSDYAHCSCGRFWNG